MAETTERETAPETPVQPERPIGVRATTKSPAEDPVFQSEDPKLVPVLTDLQRIAAMIEGDIRNLLITQRYHDLSQATRPVLDHGNLNWCTFACWASKTAGESIRSEELPEFARDLLKSEGVIEKMLAWVKRFVGVGGSSEVEFFDDVRTVLNGVSGQIAEGNLRVYAEIAPLFARFNHVLGTPDRLDEAAWTSFASRLRPGPPDDEGQDLLEVAFREYYEARFEPNTKIKAQKILVANVHVGLHEQTRLQSAIKGAMDVPAEEALEDALVAAAKARTPLEQHPEIEAKVRGSSDIVKRALIDGWERIATRVAMRLALPGGESVSLGEDVPLVDGKMFPDDLTTIDYAPLVKLINDFDADPGSTLGSAASDWSELPQRMNFILDLFRANQQNPRLFSPPFNAAQRADIEAARMPADRQQL